MIDKTSLIKKCSEFGIELTASQAEVMDRFAEILVECNKHLNLTAITEPEEVVDKHLVDSLLVLKAAEVGKNARLLDVGTGAGFPSTPIAIVRDDIKVTQLDSLNKRVNFLQEVANELELDIMAVHARAEEYSRKEQYREQFDFVTARAVASLRKLLEYCLPFVKKGGFFVAMKGSEYKEELDEAGNAIKLLDGEIEDVIPFVLPDGSKRTIILIKKISHTPTKYPRNSGKISKSPL